MMPGLRWATWWSSHFEPADPVKRLIQACFNRPVTVTAFFLLVSVLAITAYVRVPVALLPDLRYPTLVVWTPYPDVPPERVERAISERVEEAVSGTDGLQRLTSRSMLGGSMVRMDFGWNTNLDLAMLDVREQLDRLGDGLPQESDRPIVLRIDPNDKPIMILALSRADGGSSGLEADLSALKQLGREVVARRIEQLRDVARVIVTGGFDRQIDVQLDPAALAAHGINLVQLESALRTANVAQPGGSIRRGPFRYSVEVTGEFETVEDIAATVVSWSGDRPIRLRDLAEVREGVDERRGLVRYDGAETLMLLVERRPDANTVRASEEIRQALVDLQEDLDDIRLDVVVDESVFIEDAISGLTQAVLFGGLLALLVLLLFLRRKRALLAVALSVPLSLGMSLILFEALDISFNLISLSGLALGVGMLVDNAIVVVENIARLREGGMGERAAGIQGASEVAGAITASTLTTVAVFLPLTLVEGLAGRLFADQSLAIVASLSASLLVGLTVVPLVAAWSSAEAPEADPVSEGAKEEGWFVRTYESLLVRALRHRVAVTFGALVFLLVGGWLGLNVHREVVPRTNQGRVNIHLALPADADLELVSERGRMFEDAVLGSATFDHVLADVGERDESRLQVDPRPPYEADLLAVMAPEADLAEAIREINALARPADVQVEVASERTQLESLLASEEADLFVDLLVERREEGAPILEQAMAALEDLSELTNVRLSDDFEVPAYRLIFNREAMSRFGVSSSQLTTQLEAAARGAHATDLRSVNEEIPILLRTPRQATVEALLAEPVPTRGGLMPLSTFLSAQYVLLPASLMRGDQIPILRILADVSPDSDLDDATRAIEAVLKPALPASVRLRIGGANEAFRNSLRAVGISFLLSIMLVYLILAAQFESLVQPLVILMTVPLALAGVSMILLITGQTVNLMSLTGCVVLIGIVVNDAIVKVDFINQRRAAGVSLMQAIQDAGRDRLRPIIMTTVTTALGLLPLALGIGPGAELRAPMAIVIAGGLVAATLLTLIVVPVLYSLVVRPHA